MAQPTTADTTARRQINSAISARIIAYMVNGDATLRQAMEWVLGPGCYDCLVEELYHELRGEALA